MTKTGKQATVTKKGNAVEKASKSNPPSSDGGKNKSTKSPVKKADFENPTDDPA